MNNTVSFKLSLFLFFTALIFVFYSFYTSQIADGEVLGKWSSAVGLVLIFLFLLALLCLFLFVRARHTVMTLSKLVQRIPNVNFLISLSLFLFPLAVFFVWFLSDIPIFQRNSFVIGLLLVSCFPALSILSLLKSEQKKTTSVGLVVMFFSITIAVVLGELLLQLVMPQSIFNPRFGLIPHREIALQVDLPGITPGGTLTTNTWGLRGEEPPEQWAEHITIVTVGGSTTANYYLDDNLTWSHVIQQQLREIEPLVWVGNGGIPRHSAEVHYLFVKDVLGQIKPDFALFLVGVNDMGPFLRGSMATEERLPDSGAKQFFFAHSRILQLTYKIKKIYFDGASVINQSVDPYFTEVALTEVEDELPQNIHDFLEEPDFYKNRIRAIINECRSCDIEPIFMTQPLLYENNEHWRSVQEGSMWLGEADRPISAATFALMLDALNRDLIEICESEGVPVFDLASEIPHSREYFYDAMHMTEKGAQLVGEKAASFLADSII